MSRLRRVANVWARLVPYRWAWAEDHAGLTAAHWAHRTAERPALFNGRVLMLCGLEERDGTVGAAFFETGYADMTAWLDLGRPCAEVANGFAMGVLRGSDGLFVMGRMAAHTANAGQLYFPAGTPDRGDVTPAGEVDLAGSLVREIGEETGLGPADWTAEPGWTIVEEEGRVAFLRDLRLSTAAAAAAERVRGFLSGEARPELADVEIVSATGDFDAGMPAFLGTYLRAERPDQTW